MVDYHRRRKRMYQQATFLTIVPNESEPPWASLPPPPPPTPITPLRPIPSPAGPSRVSGDP
jgi:hypothetical protein